MLLGDIAFPVAARPAPTPPTPASCKLSQAPREDAAFLIAAPPALTPASSEQRQNAAFQAALLDAARTCSLQAPPDTATGRRPHLYPEAAPGRRPHLYPEAAPGRRDRALPSGPRFSTPPVFAP
jgi:hypothetical protein